MAVAIVQLCVYGSLLFHSHAHSMIPIELFAGIDHQIQQQVTEVT